MVRIQAIPSERSSPHTRGSSLVLQPAGACVLVVPAHAGVILKGVFNAKPATRRPRTRGGHPRRPVDEWGFGHVVPAHAGVIPSSRGRQPATSSRPRTRGGHPSTWPMDSTPCPSSPHTRGSSQPGHGARRLLRVVPAHAGVIPTRTPRAPPRHGRPRTRGGHPGSRFGPVRSLRSSPHTRGSSLCVVRHRRLVGVVPAHAGVIPRRSPTRRLASCRPRTRGGHPAGTSRLGRRLQSSPHTRGSSRLQSLRLPLQRVVPAHAGGHPGSRGAPCRSW